MFSTIALAKSSKFSGKIVGTHQRLDQAARLSLGQILPHGKYFPSSKEILHFEGVRGPDGLKRKSPGIDEPSHMLTQKDFERFTQHEHNLTTREFNKIVKSETTDDFGPATETGHENLDQRSVLTMILDHRWNLVKALKDKNPVRAAFEAAWMAHMITDGLTPAHHFPLSDVKNELMTDKEMVEIFGQPVKGLMHGRNPLETMRNNWLYWGAGGHMSKHIAYEYGVLMITTPLTPPLLKVKLTPDDLQDLNIEQVLRQAYQKVTKFKMYDRFVTDGWTTELAIETQEILLPLIVKTITLGWYSAALEAYHLPKIPLQKPAKASKHKKLRGTALSSKNAVKGEFEASPRKSALAKPRKSPKKPSSLKPSPQKGAKNA